MKIVGIIPARYNSTRFPAKALADIGGKSMIQRVYEQAIKVKTLNQVIVATDHQEIFDEVTRFGGHVCMTNPDHQSGTDRCYEALTSLTEKFDYVINIQGDEPFINPKQITSLTELLMGKTELATLIKRIETAEELFDPNVVKVVKNKQNEAIYFSRSTIPYIRNSEKSQWINAGVFYKHIGIYAYRSDILASITKLASSSLENAESLEQLRWLENGYHIRVAETEYPSFGVDVPKDLEKLKDFY